MADELAEVTQVIFVAHKKGCDRQSLLTQCYMLLQMQIVQAAAPASKLQEDTSHVPARLVIGLRSSTLYRA